MLFTSSTLNGTCIHTLYRCNNTFIINRWEFGFCKYIILLSGTGTIHHFGWRLICIHVVEPAQRVSKYSITINPLDTHQILTTWKVITSSYTNTGHVRSWTSQYEIVTLNLTYILRELHYWVNTVICVLKLEIQYILIGR